MWIVVGGVYCAPGGSRMEPLFASVIKTYYSLRQLGFIEVNGKVIYLEIKENQL